MNSYFFPLQIGIWKVLVHRTTLGEENWCLSLLLPVSANTEKGSDSLSLPSDRSATAMRPLMRSTWLGCWLDWQIPLKTSPILLQSSCFIQSWHRQQIQQIHTWAQRTTIFTDKAVKRCEALTSISTMEWAKFRYSGNGAPEETL